jgi:hypothetical protein
MEQSGESKAMVLGELLVKNGMISPEELAQALTQQVRQIVQRVFDSKVALFRFRERLEVHLAHNVSLDINQLLLDSARVQDEKSNAGLREEAAANQWDSWQYELSAVVSAAATGEAENTPALDAKLDPKAPSAKERSVSAEPPQDKKKTAPR